VGCNCGKGKKAVKYSVKFKDGTTATFDSVPEAQSAIRKAKGGMLRAVPAAA
jgi:hypothetical protein